MAYFDHFENWVGDARREEGRVSKREGERVATRKNECLQKGKGLQTFIDLENFYNSL